MSKRDTVALPQDSIFHDVDNCYTWIVEGEKATTNLSTPSVLGATAKGKGTERWKPQALPPTLSRSAGGSGAAKVYRVNTVQVCVFGGGAVSQA